MFSQLGGDAVRATGPEKQQVGQHKRRWVPGAPGSSVISWMNRWSIYYNMSVSLTPNLPCRTSDFPFPFLMWKHPIDINNKKRKSFRSSVKFILCYRVSLCCYSCHRSKPLVSLVCSWTRVIYSAETSVVCCVTVSDRDLGRGKKKQKALKQRKISSRQQNKTVIS